MSESKKSVFANKPKNKTESHAGWRRPVSCPPDPEGSFFPHSYRYSRHMTADCATVEEAIIVLQVG